MRYDVAIIGAGPGGYVAAIRAARGGLKTLLVEAKELGGVCLNAGCIPTKALVASANCLRTIRGAGEMGIRIEGETKVDFQVIMSRKNRIIAQLVKGLHQLIMAERIEYINDTAVLKADMSISISGKKFEAKDIIIATGSGWRPLPGLTPDSKFILTSDDILNINEVPKSLCILGGGAIGCEFASLFSALGSEVTIIEAMPEVLPMEDSGRLLTIAFKKAGIRVITGTTISSAAGELLLANGEKLSAEKLLVSIGRKPRYECIDIKGLGILMDGDAIRTDENMRTNIDGIYAIGDVNGKYMLAHVASEEAVVATENIMGRNVSIDYSAVPRPVYTHPEVSCVGATEKALTKESKKFSTGKFAYIASSKAICDGLNEGQVTVYVDKETRRVLGAQIVGEHATEITSELALAIRNGLKAADVAGTIHSHPTLSEIIKEAVLDADGQAVHKVYKK